MTELFSLHNSGAYSPADAQARLSAFGAELQSKTSVHDFADQPVPRELIEGCIRTACAAPRSSPVCPWHIVAISDPALKMLIREAAEEEAQSTSQRGSNSELPTSTSKKYLEKAPWLLVIFAHRYALEADGTPHCVYNSTEATGMATGFLIAALHVAGLGTLAHTPSPQKFLNYLLQRPAREQPFLMIATGYPTERPELLQPTQEHNTCSSVTFF